MFLLNTLLSFHSLAIGHWPIDMQDIVLNIL